MNQAVVKKATDEGSVRFAVGSTHLYWNRSREEEQVFELKQSEEMFRSRLSWSVVKIRAQNKIGLPQNRFHFFTVGTSTAFQLEKYIK